MIRSIICTVGALSVLAMWGGTAGHRLASRPATPPGTAEASSRAAAQDASNQGGILVVQSDFMGHYTVHPEIEGHRTAMMVDTGASIVALTAKDAAAAGYRPAPHEYKTQISTANGRVAVAPIRIREMRVGNITVRDVEAVVVPGGSLGTSLLGMSFLRRLGGFEVSGGRLTLRG